MKYDSIFDCDEALARALESPPLLVTVTQLKEPMKSHHDHAEITAGLEHGAPKIGEHFAKPGPRRVRAGAPVPDSGYVPMYRQNADVPPAEGAGWVRFAVIASCVILGTLLALDYFGVLR